MSQKQKEVVFLATINYDYERRNKGMCLSLHNNNSENCHEKLEPELRSVIASELPNDLLRIYGLNVETRVIEIRSGSILVFFGAVVGAIGFLSNYADFFESVKLIKQHSEMLILQLMRKRCGGNFDVNVVEKYPFLPDPNNRFPWRRLRKMFGSEADEFLQDFEWMNSYNSKPRRDGFFWFLLVFNILLLATIGVLVGGAVTKTYFP